MRNSILPSALTDSAREARKAFHCDLCNKGYARINDFQAHEGSYDHQHKQRLKDMKAMTQNPTAAIRASKAEKRRTEKSDMMSGNLQSERPSTTRTTPRDSNRPAGWPAEAVVAAPVESTPKGQRMEETEDDEEVVWEDRPVGWDELEDVDGLVDLESYRPQPIQKFLQGQAEYRKATGEGNYFEDIWKRVGALQGGARNNAVST